MEEQKTVTPAPQPPSQPAGAGDDIEKAKGTAWLSYLGILWLIPMLTLKDNAFAKWHVKQGIALDIASVGMAIVMTILSFILIGFVIGPIGFLLILIFRIIGLIKALQGQYWKCPLGISKIAEMFKF